MISLPLQTDAVVSVIFKLLYLYTSSQTVKQIFSFNWFCLLLVFFSLLFICLVVRFLFGCLVGWLVYLFVVVRGGGGWGVGFVFSFVFGLQSAFFSQHRNLGWTGMMSPVQYNIHFIYQQECKHCIYSFL